MNCQNLINFVYNIENAIMFAKLNTLHNGVISVKDLQNIIDYLTKSTVTVEYSFSKMHHLTMKLQVYKFHLPMIKKYLLYIQLFQIQKNSITSTYILFLKITEYTYIPELPYLILGTRTHQYIEDGCPRIEDPQFCLNSLEPTKENGPISIIREAKNTERLRQLHLSEHLIEQISDQFVLIIPAYGPMKIRKECRTKGQLNISDPVFVKFNKIAPL